MALNKQQRIENLNIDFITGHLIVRGIVRVIDTADNNKVIASQVKEIKINPRDNTKAASLGIGGVATKIWDYLNV